MTIQHIAMVYDADGLTSNEKHLLGAYCNHTDAHGYCWPGVARLVDETGMSRATVKRTNAALRAKKLIRSVRRVNPKTGEPITNLTRVNVPLLASMKRPEQQYDDDLIGAISFGDDDPVPPKTASDLLMAQSEPYLGLNLSPTRGQSEPYLGLNLSPKPSIEPSVRTSSSPPSNARQSQPSRRREEEASPKDQGGGTVSPLAASGDGEHQAVAAAFVSELPGVRTRGDGRRLTGLIAAALAAGWTVEQVRAELLRDLASASSRTAVWITRLRDLGSPPPAAPAPPSLPPRCGNPEHDPNSADTDRMLYSDDRARPCPTCHPKYLLGVAS